MTVHTPTEMEIPDGWIVSPRQGPDGKYQVLPPEPAMGIQDKMSAQFYAQQLRSPVQLPMATRQRIISTCRTQIGKAHYGRGTSPPVMDCSGFVLWGYGQHTNFQLPWNSEALSMASFNPYVRTVQPTLAHKRELLPADLIFYYSPIGHVAMYSYSHVRQFHVVQMTDPNHGCQEIFMRQYADPVAYGFMCH